MDVFRAALKRRASQREISAWDLLDLPVLLGTGRLLRRSVVGARGIARPPGGLPAGYHNYWKYMINESFRARPSCRSSA